MVISFCGHSDFQENSNLKTILIDKLTDFAQNNNELLCYCGGYGNFDHFAAECVNIAKIKCKNIKNIFVSPYLDEKYIRNIANYKIFDAIIYPELKKIIEGKILENRNRNIVVNGAVLYKIPEILSLCTFVLYIYSPFFTRLVRLIKRDKIPFPQLIERMKAQKNLFAKYSEQYADIVKVKNRGTLENLEKNLLTVLARYGL